MKIKLLFSLLVVVFFGILLSCNSSPKVLAPEHEGLIGTKWLSVVSNSKDTLEFVDKTFCSFINKGKEQYLRYTFKDNNIMIGNLFTYVLKGDVIYLVGYPAYNKIQ